MTCYEMLLTKVESSTPWGTGIIAWITFTSHNTQHSTLNTQQSSYNHNSRSNTLYTHKENSKMTHNRHTHTHKTRQDHHTHTQTLTVQHTIHYTGTQPRRYKSATHTPDTMDRHTHFIPTQITLQAPTLYHHNTILSYTHYTPENFILIHFQNT